MGEAIILKIAYALRFLSPDYVYPECPGTTHDKHDPRYERTSCRGFPESKLPLSVAQKNDDRLEFMKVEEKEDPPPAYEEGAER